MHSYEVRPRKDKRGVDLISDALPFGGLSYTKPDDAVSYAKFFSRSHDAVIRVYDEAGNVIETHEHAGANCRAITRKDPERPVIAPSVAKPSAFASVRVGSWFAATCDALLSGKSDAT